MCFSCIGVKWSSKVLYFEELCLAIGFGSVGLAPLVSLIPCSIIIIIGVLLTFQRPQSVESQVKKANK